MHTNIFPGRDVLTMDDMFKIHQSMLEVLRDPGVEIRIPADLLQKLAGMDGVKVDVPSSRVRLEAGPVLETIRQFTGAAEPTIGRNGSVKPVQPRRIPKKITGIIGSHHAYVFDSDVWKPRPATHADIRNFIKLRKSLPDVNQRNIGFIPLDVPQEVSYIHAMALSAKYQKNPAAVASAGLQDAEWVARIMTAVGALPPGKPFVTTPYTSPPLRLEGTSVEFFLDQLKKGIPPFVGAMGILGGTGPVTLAGTMVVLLAEYFGFNTISRLLCPPPNNKFSPRAIGCDMAVMDPRKGNCCLTRPEGMLLRLMMRQLMGAFYRMPGGSGFSAMQATDAAEPGIQTAIENTLGPLMEIFSGYYSYEDNITVHFHDLGAIQGFLCVSAEQVLIDHEILRWVQKMVAEIPVTDDTIALDVIREVGPGGSFLASEHTLNHYRGAIWQTKLFHDGPWQAWLDAGRKSPFDRAKETIREIFAQELEPVLPDDKLKEVEQLVREADKALLGRETGVAL